jgi:hypothetical protein
MQRKSQHQLDYDRGDKRIREAVNEAWQSWFIPSGYRLHKKHNLRPYDALYGFPYDWFYKDLPFDNLGI